MYSNRATRQEGKSGGRIDNHEGRDYLTGKLDIGPLGGQKTNSETKVQDLGDGLFGFEPSWIQGKGQDKFDILQKGLTVQTEGKH